MAGATPTAAAGMATVCHAHGGVNAALSSDPFVIGVVAVVLPGTIGAGPDSVNVSDRISIDCIP